MNKTILALVFAAFLGLNAYALVNDGLISGFTAFFQTMNGWGLVLCADLVIALSLVSTWLVRDARQRGRSAAPYVALTLATGSIGPLLYLLRRK